MNAFEILGIEPTQDKKTIKKAYAALVKKYHPEEDMQKWQEIHEAYQSALEWADGRNYLTKTVAASGGILTDGADVEEQEEAELNNLFDNLEELSAASKAEKLEQEKRELQKALTALDQMERYNNLGYDDWKELFSREEYQQAMGQDAFLNRWSEILKNRTIDKRLYQLMEEQLERIAQNQEGYEQAKEMVGLIDPIQLTEMRIRSAYVRYRETGKKRNRIAVCAILILIEVVPSLFYGINRWKEEREWKMHVQDSINFEYNLRQGNEEWINENKKGLNTVSDLDLIEATLSLDNLAEFLMRADEEIVSIIFPYTQTLNP